MKRYLSTIILATAVTVFCLPDGALAQTGGHRSVDHGRYDVPVSRTQGRHSMGSDNGRHRYRGRNRRTHGYRNYGQYRRTQVGRRQYHIEDYWRRRHF